MGGAFGDIDAFLKDEGGQLAVFLLRTRGRGIVGCRWRCGQFRVFFDGVLLSRKIHKLLLAGVVAVGGEDTVYGGGHLELLAPWHCRVELQTRMASLW